MVAQILYPEDLRQLHWRVVGNILRAIPRVLAYAVAAAAVLALFAIDSWSPVVAEALIRVATIG